MTFCRHYCICCRDLLRTRTVLVQFIALAAGPIVNIASLGARRVHCICLDQIMYMVQLRDCFFFRVALIIAAGPSLKAFLFLCCFLYNSPLAPVVTRRSYYCIFCCDLCCSLIITEQLFAFAAGPIVNIASLGARCILRFGLLKRMAFCCYYCVCCRDLLRTRTVLVQFIALAAGPIVNIASLGARRVHCICLDQIMYMVQLRDCFFFRVALIIAAGPSLKAFLFLCCFLYNSPLAPVVTRRSYYCIRCRDLCCSLIITEQFFALAAGPVLGVTSFGACCILRFGLLKRMTLRGYYCIRCHDLCCSLIITEQFFALTAGPVLGITGFGAGCILRFGLLKRMTFCRHYCICCRDLSRSFFIAEQLFTLNAGPVLDVAGLGARCILRVCLNQIVNMLQLAERNFVLVVIIQRILII